MKSRTVSLLVVSLGLAVTSSALILRQPDAMSSVVRSGFPADVTIGSAEKKEAINGACEALKTNYVFPDVAIKIIAALRSHEKAGDFDSITSGQQFADRVTEVLESVNGDKHLRLLFNEAVLAKDGEGGPNQGAINEMFNTGQIRNYEFQTVERLPGNIGYIRFNNFLDSTGGAETVRAAMTFVKYTDALILDLRTNGGGDPHMGALICSYFFKDRTHLNDLYFRPSNQTVEFWTNPKDATYTYTGDLYILTSQGTFSAAEGFSYALHNLKRCRIVGETTGGGAHPGGTTRIADHFEIFVPIGRAISPITKTDWEGTGVKPDVTVPANKALATAKLELMKKLQPNLKTRRDKADVAKAIADLEKELNSSESK